MIDATWIGACLSCLLWLALLPFAIFAKPAERISSVGKLPKEEPKWGKYASQPQSQSQPPSSVSYYYPRQHNSVLTRGSSILTNNNNYSSTTPLTQHQTLPEPTLPNMYYYEPCVMYEPTTTAGDYYGRNYYDYDHRGSHHGATMPQRQEQMNTESSLVQYNNDNTSPTTPENNPTTSNTTNMINYQQTHNNGEVASMHHQQSTSYPSPLEENPTSTSERPYLYYPQHH